MAAAYRILIAGIGGASLGTEIIKCLRGQEQYQLFGCDISELAYGHFESGLETSFTVHRQAYVEDVLKLATENGIHAIIPGGQEPLELLGAARPLFEENGIHIAGNSSKVIQDCSDKALCVQIMDELDLPVPFTLTMETLSSFEGMTYPCVVKPAQGTGGSSFVFLADNENEARLYVSYLIHNAKIALVQEYLPLDDGEFTVGVLSLPNGHLVGSIAMKRIFNTKLSVMTHTKSGLISSGYSQGLIDSFPEVQRQCERIAQALCSVGPMNIQGRLVKGRFVTFEINPRFSASTYLRTLAGFNELEIYLTHALEGETLQPPQIQPGYYLRSLTEVQVKKGSTE